MRRRRDAVDAELTERSDRAQAGVRGVQAAQRTSPCEALFRFGSVRASCQGTVRARLANRTGEKVVYTLRVGTKVHRIGVRSETARKFVTHGRPRAKVTLKVGSTRLDKLRIPALCVAPEVLPDTGLRATSR